VRPYDAFSTFAPEMMRPSSTIAATPTGKFEYGEYEWVSASLATPLRASHSMAAGSTGMELL
jgi:hypothetical protein